MEINQDKLQEYIESLNSNVNEFTDITDKVVKEQSADLDELMEAIKFSVTQEDAISTDAIERYYAELTNLVYFMSDRIGKLNVYKDMSKAMTKEAYNNAYLSYSMEKDERGKSLRTVNENSALADNESKIQSTIETVYAAAANILKENGAKEIYAGVAHGVLVGPAIERIQNSPIKELVVTNTIPIEPEKMIDKIKVVSIAPLFAEAIKRINESKPLGDLFEDDK